jgi:hypothetical protein
MGMSFRFALRARVRLIFALSILVIAGRPTFSLAAAEDVSEYQVKQRWPLTGQGSSGFLLVGEKDHRLYISRDTQLTVMDTNDGKTIGEIHDLTDVRGIALDGDGQLGYIGDGISGTLKVFSVPTLKVTSSIKIGGTPDAVVFEPVTRRIFVFDSHNKAAVVVDPSSLKVVGRVPLPGRPGGAIVDGTGSIFVNLVSTSQLARIDVRSLGAPKLTPLSPCVGPSGIAMDSAHSRIFSVCENKRMAVSDSHTGEPVATVPIGEGAKTVGFDPAGELVFIANGEGTLTVIKEDGATTFSPLRTVKTEPGARTMAFDQQLGQLYLISARFGQRTGPTSEELEFRPTPVSGSSVVLVIKP